MIDAIVGLPALACAVYLIAVMIPRRLRALAEEEDKWRSQEMVSREWMRRQR